MKKALVAAIALTFLAGTVAPAIAEVAGGTQLAQDTGKSKKAHKGGKKGHKGGKKGKKASG